MTNDEPKRRGKARSGKPRNRMLPFSVTPEDETWLLTLPNRSEWLRGKIEQDRDTSRATNRAADTPDAQAGAPGSPTPF